MAVATASLRRRPAARSGASHCPMGDQLDIRAAHRGAAAGLAQGSRPKACGGAVAADRRDPDAGNAALERCEELTRVGRQPAGFAAGHLGQGGRSRGRTAAGGPQCTVSAAADGADSCRRLVRLVPHLRATLVSTATTSRTCWRIDAAVPNRSTLTAYAPDRHAASAAGRPVAGRRVSTSRLRSSSRRVVGARLPASQPARRWRVQSGWRVRTRRQRCATLRTQVPEA